MDSKYLVLIIAFATIEINSIESRQSDKRRWKSDKGLYNSHYTNICDIQDRGSKVHCYCENIKLKTATRADCWVFNGGIAEDDPFWSNFYSQPKIERLTFNVRADGGLTYVPAKVIIRLERLHYLNIQYANINTISSFAFTNSSTLREIILPKNKITKLELLSFSHLIQLSNLSLVDNQVSEIRRDVFYVLPNLQRLYLSKNSISVLHDGCFKHLNNLIELDLDSNLITVVIREAFQGLSNLISLDMRNNKLTMIGDLAFAELWSLQELYLDTNEIEFISERGFGGLTNLRKLFLSSNKLENLNDGVFDEMKKILILDLKNNRFNTLTKETVEHIMTNLKNNYAMISLDGNNFKCDCRLSWIHVLRNETQSKRVKAALERFVCTIDEKNGGKFDVGDKPEIPSSSKTGLKINTNNNEDNNYEDNDVDGLSEEKMYDDTPVHLEITDSKVELKKKLLDIPFELLPCPHKLMNNELPYSFTSNDDVKYYKSSSNCVNHTSHLITLVLMIIVSNP